MIVRNYSCNVLCKFWIKFESTWRREIKEQTPQPTLLYCGRTVRSPHRRCSMKKVVLRNFAIPAGNTRVGVFFLKSCWSKNICKRLLFGCFNGGSLLHGPKVSRSWLYDGISLQGLQVFPGFSGSSGRHLSSWTEIPPAFESLRQIPWVN